MSSLKTDRTSILIRRPGVEAILQKNGTLSVVARFGSKRIRFYHLTAAASRVWCLVDGSRSVERIQRLLRGTLALTEINTICYRLIDLEILETRARGAHGKKSKN